MPDIETVNVKIDRTMNYYPDGTTMTHVEAGDVVEMSVKWAETFEREGWGFITHKTPAPATGGQEDGDDGPDKTESSDDPDDKSSVDTGAADLGEEGSKDGGGDEDSDSGSGEGASSDEGDTDEDDEDEPAASPKAVETAVELGVDLRSVVGTGTDGLITVDDVRGAVADADPGV